MSERCDRRLLSLYRDGELAPKERARVDAHLRGCSECAAALRGYVDIARSLRSVPDRAAPPEIRPAVYRQIAEREVEPASLGLFGSLARAATPALGAAALAVTVLVVFRPGAGELSVGAPVAQPAATTVGSAPTGALPKPGSVGPVVVGSAPGPGERTGGAGPQTRIGQPVAASGMPQSISRLYGGNRGLQERLGRPRQGSRTTKLLEQSFQGGLALWRADTDEIYVLNRTGSSWTAYQDNSRAPDLSAVELAPPAGALTPAGGVGKLWRNRPDVRARLGWAVYEPRGSGSRIQAFEHGQIVWSPHGLLYVLFEDGTWKTYPDATPI